MKEVYKEILLGKSMIPGYVLLFISVAILILGTGGFLKMLGTPLLVLTMNLFLASILIQMRGTLKEMSGKMD